MTTVLTTTENGVATLTLNRPDQGNTIDMMLAEDLRAAAQAVAADPAVRCVILTSAGRSLTASRLTSLKNSASAFDQISPFAHDSANV